MRRGRTATRSAALLSVLLAALSLGPRDAYAEGGLYVFYVRGNYLTGCVPRGLVRVRVKDTGWLTLSVCPLDPEPPAPAPPDSGNAGLLPPPPQPRGALPPLALLVLLLAGGAAVRRSVRGPRPPPP